MDRFSQTELEQLITATDAPCVSIYLPTYRTGEQAQQNRIRLKNLLDRAEQYLSDRELRSPMIREFLEPARALERDATFWHAPGDGLALFCSAATLRAWRLPQSFAEFVWVGNHFYIKPLLPLVGIDTRYHVLAVSPARVRLFSGAQFELDEIDLATLPKNLVEALHYHQPEGMFQVRTGNPAVRGKHKKESAVFHGQGSAEHEKDDLRAYFRQIDGALHPYLRDRNTPLVFAGVESLFPIYREVNSYPHLQDEPIGGNPDLIKRAELLDRARKILSPHWSRTQQRDAQMIQDLAASGRVSADVEQIVFAARDGRVEVLFVAEDVHVWGRFDEQRRRVELLPGPQGGEDLLDRAARDSLFRGARVYAITAMALPEGLVAAAMYRYVPAPYVNLARP